MRVFVTGATGFIGSRVVPELIGAGHEVLGLSRTEERVQALRSAGAEVLVADMMDFPAIADAIRQTDGVIHLAFNHDFSRFTENAEDNRRLIIEMGTALAGTNKPIVITSGTAMSLVRPGQTALEDDPLQLSHPNPRISTEVAANEIRDLGVNTTVVRLPQVHDPERQGLWPIMIDSWRKAGHCFWIGDGSVRWPAAHVDDVAVLYRLALERGEPGAVFNAVAEEGVTMRAVAETVGRRLGLPAGPISAEEAAPLLGWLIGFATLDMPASSEKTRRVLGWTPTGPTLLEDMANLRVAPL